MSRLPKVGVNFHNAVSWITKGAGTQVKHANGRGAVTDPPGLAERNESDDDWQQLKKPT